MYTNKTNFTKAHGTKEKAPIAQDFHPVSNVSWDILPRRPYALCTTLL